ncbi:unnamed protein product [Didymodactylos carnosus]|uniref:Peptide deformylase n=1 Tax=Didymodactylos carnosus TaxID=1234261 RepID=A0A814XTR8_9BILA|nr:unnamed protein product [Didymodactylos carnosus]CAF1369345.1 unnamed protein product [Didymodactylos carnosus]CAF3983686.1 unnamed protein product [Didymodactylos carnosus]CAF4178648.1 unnamed protein product [Didymodactylos carnosus]
MTDKLFLQRRQVAMQNSSLKLLSRAIKACVRSQSTNPYSSRWVVSHIDQQLHTISTPNICLIGDQKLRIKNEPISDVNDKEFLRQKLLLHKALDQFRKVNGFGRGMSANQVGINLQVIALNLGYGSFSLINPKIVWQSVDDRITLWDDCMSIPQMMIKKQRYKHVSISYLDDDGNKQIWNELPVCVSELLQHEIDHINGILATDEPWKDANSNDWIISMNEYRKHKQYFDGQVDYSIQATV